MARDYWHDTMLERFESTPGAGDWAARPMRDIRVSVYAPGTTTLQTIYTARTGGATKVNPFTTGDDGYAEFYADSAEYDIKIDDTIAPARVTAKTIGWSAVNGGAAGIPPSQLASGITQALLAAVLQEALWAPGDLKMRGGVTVPSGWLACDGSAVNRTTYAALYAALGGAASPWGQGDGSTTFNTPDLRGRVPVNVDGTAGRLAANDALGQSGGVPTVALTAAEGGVAAHGHADTIAINDPNHSHVMQTAGKFGATGGAPSAYYGEFTPNSGTSVGNTMPAATGVTKTGGVTAHAGAAGVAHTNLQPYAIVNFIVKT